MLVPDHLFIRWFLPDLRIAYGLNLYEFLSPAGGFVTSICRLCFKESLPIEGLSIGGMVSQLFGLWGHFAADPGSMREKTKTSFLPALTSKDPPTSQRIGYTAPRDVCLCSEKVVVGGTCALTYERCLSSLTKIINAVWDI